jgi:hypothetical protein
MSESDCQVGSIARRTLPKTRLVSSACTLRVYLVVEGHIVDLDFIRPNANDRAVFLVQTAALEQKLALMWEDVVVELIQVSECCEARAGDMGDAGEVETVDGNTTDVTGE